MQHIALDRNDGDALAPVDQAGAARHTGRRSCFYTALEPGGAREVAPPLADPETLYGRR